MKNFDLQNFYHFCRQLKIETKEQGLRKMDNLLGTQTYVMQEITKGLQDDCHFFVILKGRQLGITTISLALDLYCTSPIQGFKAHSQLIRKRIGICSDQPLPCIWMVCPRSTASRSLLTTEISFPSRTAAVSFIKSLGLELKEVWVVVRLLHTYMEQKPQAGAMKKD